MLSPEDQQTIMTLINIQRDAIGFNELNEAFAETQEVLMRLPQYSQPIPEMQMVCNDSQQIIDLLRQITDLQWKHFIPPPQCDHTELEQRKQTVTDKRDEARGSSAAPGTNEEHRQELAEMTHDAQESGEDVSGLRMQLPSPVTLAA